MQNYKKTYITVILHLDYDSVKCIDFLTKKDKIKIDLIVKKNK